MQLTQLAHQYLETHLNAGSFAIDATAGNGHDCLKMATLIGPTGRLIAIDIQAAAIEATRQRLTEAAIPTPCELLEGNHAEQLEALCQAHRAHVHAITFNLGYLPGSDKTIQTQPADTLRALDAASALLHPQGVLLVTAYRGHAGGMEEAEHVANWMQQQQAQGKDVGCHEPKANRIPPILWVLKPT